MPIIVAPLVGARIEISVSVWYMRYAYVAPLAGARIEISSHFGICVSKHVAPLAGARIEIPASAVRLLLPRCRSPRGSAD